ncbi:DUF4147 domain-containing protein [Noviherbaspirillum sedimenti]|uniref:DUF4147 domain-containing protein n=1 Tax=Noviherbaspirillum sedimenti TaxID=2320865 RepID=UPI001F1587ED|nr:DUF4147 domain-containing protein [Noviherbaspirillum sedimenti]
MEPVAGISLADKQQVTQAMFQAGATIRELNGVRQALSLVKGGGLAAAAWPARVLTLVISDVPGDDPAFVASGPTVAPPADPEPPLEIVARLGLRLPPHVVAALGRPVTRTPQDFAHCRTELIATPMQSLQAAAARARIGDRALDSFRLHRGGGKGSRTGTRRHRAKHAAFSALGNLVMTGPTHTNVNDFRAILIR